MPVKTFQQRTILAKGTISIKRGTTAQWAANDPILWKNEPGYDSDVGNFKVGDGIRKWSQLPWVVGAGDTNRLLSIEDVTVDLQGP